MRDRNLNSTSESEYNFIIIVELLTRCYLVLMEVDCHHIHSLVVILKVRYPGSNNAVGIYSVVSEMEATLHGYRNESKGIV